MIISVQDHADLHSPYRFANPCFDDLRHRSLQIDNMRDIGK